ncbi:hypothetical protein [Methanolapillus millepedarum]|uniref:Uncharacterized protein n=1 Tax=Methanolapillus millepedarum TaxID=3028296 RepID=A0AA96ZW53_9EURY|nr:hypothetical protein MsAc7_17540 [Methanosarcinaceae archaeon Ac7]
MQFTPNYTLKKPEPDDDYNVQDFNDNEDITDATMKGFDTNIKTINEKLAAGVGDYTEPTIKAAPTESSILDGDAFVKIAASDGKMKRTTWTYIKSALKTFFDTVYSPKSHASAGTDYGTGTTTQYGHVMVIDNINEGTLIAGHVLSAKQGKLLNDSISGLQYEMGNLLPNAFGTYVSLSRDDDEFLIRGTSGEDRVIGATTYSSLVSRLQNSFSPRSHQSADNRYGLGTKTMFGHVKTIDAVTSSSYTDGEALSAKQGYDLNQKIENNKMSAVISAASRKSTPATTDRFPYQDVASGNVVYATIDDFKSAIGGGSVGMIATIPAAAWTGSAAPYSANVSVPGMTASKNYIVSQAPDTVNEYNEFSTCGLNSYAQDIDQITIRAYRSKPTIDLKIKVIILG